MCVIGFIRTSFGGPLNAAVITRLLNGIKYSATADLGSHVDMMHPMADSFTAVYGEFQRQMLMVSLKEIYGYAAIAAVVILLAILASDYRHYVGSRINRMLKLPQVWRSLHSRTMSGSRPVRFGDCTLSADGKIPHCGDTLPFFTGYRRCDGENFVCGLSQRGCFRIFVLVIT